MTARSYWFWMPPTRLAGMREIAAMVAEKHGLSLADLIGPDRPNRIAHPRQEAYALIHATGRFSQPQIGRFFGGRDHTTVHYGILAHKDRIAGRCSTRKRAA